MDEVGNPTILATFTVIAAILPMAFVGGLMGPYMRPIPIGASAAMLFSLVVAFVVSPWAPRASSAHQRERRRTTRAPEGWSTRLYRRVMVALLDEAARPLGASSAWLLALLLARRAWSRSGS